MKNIYLVFYCLLGLQVLFFISCKSDQTSSIKPNDIILHKNDTIVEPIEIDSTLINLNFLEKDTLFGNYKPLDDEYYGNAYHYCARINISKNGKKIIHNYLCKISIENNHVIYFDWDEKLSPIFKANLPQKLNNGKATFKDKFNRSYEIELLNHDEYSCNSNLENSEAKVGKVKNNHKTTSEIISIENTNMISEKFTNLNEVYDINIQKEEIEFKFNQNSIIFDQINGWQVSKTGKNIKLDGYQDYFLESDLPTWFSGGKYDYIEDTFVHNGNKFFLVNCFGEGGDPNNTNIVDVNNRTQYSNNYIGSSCLAITDSSFWLGGKNKISNVDRITGKMTDYYIIPSCDSISGYQEYKDTYIITTHNGHIFNLSENSGEVEFLEPPSSLIEKFYPHAFDYSSYNFKLRYSNPIIVNNKLYVAAFAILREWYSYGASGLLIYDLITKKWDFQNLGSNINIVDLVLKDNKILCLGNYFEEYEGGDFNYFGGLAIFDIATNETFFINEIRGMKILGYQYYKDNVYFNVNHFSLNNNLVMKVNLKDLKYSSINIHGDNRYLSKFTPIKTALSEIEMEKMNNLKVKYQIMAKENFRSFIITKN